MTSACKQRAPAPPAAAATSRRPPAAPAPRPWPPWRRSAHAAAAGKWRLRDGPAAGPAAPGSRCGAERARPARRDGRAGRCEAPAPPRFGSPAPTGAGLGEQVPSLGNDRARGRGGVKKRRASTVGWWPLALESPPSQVLGKGGGP